jgi:hypothetical protein
MISGHFQATNFEVSQRQIMPCRDRARLANGFVETGRADLQNEEVEPKYLKYNVSSIVQSTFSLIASISFQVNFSLKYILAD